MPFGVNLMRYTDTFSIGLTGGIASGKSTAAQVLRHLGATVVDADAHSRRLTAVGGAAIEPIRAAFGADFINAAGALDRSVMRSHVFANPAAKKILESILHPMIFQACALEAQAWQSVAHAPYVVFDIPLLLESGADWRMRFDFLAVIDVSPEVQLARLRARGFGTEADIAGVLKAQLTQAQRHAVVQAAGQNGTCISNEGDVAALAQVLQVWDLRWRAIAGRTGAAKSQ